MKKLLLADDSATIQRVLELTFSAEDIQVVAVQDGEAAIAQIQADRPDIVLADIGMPKRSGYDVSAFVKGDPALASIPVLLLAGAFEPVDEARATLVKCDGVLAKPFEPPQVIARVRELLDGAGAGSPATATPGVPRPVERLTSLKLVEPRYRSAPVVSAPPVASTPTAPRVTPVPAAVAPAPAPVPAAAPASSPRQMQDDAAVARTTPTTSQQILDDSLDDYFDRLDAAFAKIEDGTAAKEPAQESSRQTSRTTTVSAVPEPDEDAPLPTIDSLLGLRDVTPGSASVDVALNAPEPTPAPALAPRAVSPSLLPVPPVMQVVPPPVSAPPIEPAEVSPSLTSVPEPVALDRETPDVVQRRNTIADAFSALLAAELGEPVEPVQLAAPRAAEPPRLAEPQISDALIDDVTRRVVARLGSDAVRAIVADVVADVAERLIREEIARIRRRS